MHRYLHSAGRLAIAAAVTAVTAVTLFAIPVYSQNSSFSGSVLVDGTNRPLANAEVTFTALKLSTLTDKAGNFKISGLPAGKHDVVVRLVGYEPFSDQLTFGTADKVEADVTLMPLATKLAKVDVKDKKKSDDPRLAEFEERRLTPGSGRFITADVFEKQSGSRITDILLGRIPGIRRVNMNGTPIRPLATTRGGQGKAIMGANLNCFVQVVVNNMVMYNSHSTNYYDIDQLNAADVIGVEFYTVASQPLKFNATDSNCGTVVIWTK